MAGKFYHATVTETGPGTNVYDVIKPSDVTSEQLSKLTITTDHQFEISSDEGSTWFPLGSSIRTVSDIECRGISSVRVRRFGGGTISVNGVFE